MTDRPAARSSSRSRPHLQARRPRGRLVLSEVDATNTRAEWMSPPEVRDPQEYGAMDHRIDIYHAGLLLLQIAVSKRSSSRKRRFWQASQLHAKS